MIYLDLPISNAHGWGLCGKHLVKALSAKTDVRLIKQAADLKGLDLLETHFLASYLLSPDDFQAQKQLQQGYKPLPMLQAIPYQFPSWTVGQWPAPAVTGTWNIGYTFLEESIISPQYRAYLEQHWDIVVTGASWACDALKAQGLQNITSIIQGIDPNRFHSGYAIKTGFLDQFVIFSGGKFELRKGQDVVIKAFAVLHKKYKDMLLVAAWHNPWPTTMRSMAQSRHIHIPPVSGSAQEILQQILVANGIDRSRVILLPAYGNEKMPEIYQNTDIGLFPNRCEGGTNLVMMEYMACGKPVIASFSSGHKDLLTDRNALLLKNLTSKGIVINQQQIATWDEPHLDEVVAQIEWAYQHREALYPYAVQAAADLSKLTWGKTAAQFYTLLTQSTVVASTSGH